jgi:hypothetical protein
VTQPLIQNFSVPANSDQILTFTITSGIPNDSLVGATIYWRVYDQEFGCVVPTIPPVISKSSLSGGGITILASPPMTFTVDLLRTDTVNLLRNYYHEATVVDEIGENEPVTVGIMTVTGTENRF